MSRDRFALRVTLLAVAVAAVSFAAGLRVLDDGNPDPAPNASSLDVDANDTSLPSVEITTTTSTTVNPVATGELATPAWVTIIASEGSQAEAERAARPVAAAGYPTGILHSDDYPSLKSGLWVTYTGPYPDASSAEAAVEQLAADGFSDAYVRCVGTEKDCDQHDSDD